MEWNGLPKRIAVGLVGSEGSKQALQRAIYLARPLSAEIGAVHVESMGAYIPDQWAWHRSCTGRTRSTSVGARS